MLMRNKPKHPDNDQKDQGLPVKKSPLVERGIIQPFRKPPRDTGTCGINRDKNPCGDASEY